ncbi:MAG: DUF3078 domain-containing protein [Lentimicrobium sp.]|nr:DUF3078 domain-containing protein [Lentimicrobiaceae bacterium]MCO5267250.1 DUF3078 domain-containing protein [Lentimicrobium sp.]
MQKALLSLIIVIAASLSGAAQTADTTKLWTTGIKTSLSFSQVSLTNWAAGGENSLGGNSFINLIANMKKARTTWDNSLDLAYGLIKQGDAKVRKSDDKIDFVSKVGHNVINKHLFLSANLSFRTQFTDGFNYPNDSVLISTFMAPGYLMLGLGMDYKPYPYLSVSLLPVTGRLTIVGDKGLSDAGAYGVDPGKTIRPEFGASLKATFEKDIITNVNLKSKLELFSNYVDRPQNIDINWEALLILKVNKLISTYIGLQTVYDHDIQIMDKDGKTGPRTQFKQTFGIGLTYAVKHYQATIKQ